MTENIKADVSLSRTARRIFIAWAEAGLTGTDADARSPIEHGITAGETLRGAWRRCSLSGLLFLGLFGLFRPFDRRQCLDVGRHRVAIFGRELWCVADDRRHRTADRIAIRRLAS